MRPSRVCFIDFYNEATFYSLVCLYNPSDRFKCGTDCRRFYILKHRPVPLRVTTLHIVKTKHIQAGLTKFGWRNQKKSDMFSRSFFLCSFLLSHRNKANSKTSARETRALCYRKGGHFSADSWLHVLSCIFHHLGWYYTMCKKTSLRIATPVVDVVMFTYGYQLMGGGT